MNDHVVRIKRGRGRPPKAVQVVRWSQVPAGVTVEVDDEKGPWIYKKLCDNGDSIVVVGGPFGHTRSFSVERVSVKISELTRDAEGV